MSYLDLTRGVEVETRTSFKIVRCSRFAPQVGAARALVFQSGANQGVPLLDARATSAAKSLARRRFPRSTRRASRLACLMRTSLGLVRAGAPIGAGNLEIQPKEHTMKRSDTETANLAATAAAKPLKRED